MSKLLFVSRSALIHDLAWEVLKEGHDVKYYIQSKADKDVADGTDAAAKRIERVLL